MKRLVWLGALLGALPSMAIAQTSNERAVRAVVDSFFSAITREKWDSAAAFLDLPRFEPYFNDVVRNARSALPQREMTVDDVLATDSTMPRAVAEWQIAQMKKYSGRGRFGDMSFQFAGVHSQQDLFALKLPEAAARWIEAQDERTQMREAWRQSGCSLSDLPPFPAAKRTVLAVAIANDSTAYVIHSDDRFGGGDAVMFSSDRIMPLHKSNGRWRIQAREDLMRPINMSFGMGQCPKVRRP